MNDLQRAAGLAALTGSRTFVTPALVSRTMVRRAPLRAAAYLLAAVELIGDKLPGTPNRTSPLSLAMRLACGAGVARAMLKGRARGRGPAAGAGAALLGAACAGLAAFAGLALRRALARRLGGGQSGNVAAGLLEDLALIALGTRLARP